MIDFMKVFDAYSLRARLFPAIIAAAPALAALALLISWKSFELSNIIATISIFVLLFAVADFSRAQGRKIELKLHSEYGGLPSITMFRRSDPTIAQGLKDRYRAFLAGKLGTALPSLDEELASQHDADSFYEQCGVWLRQNTRDTKKFPILFNENITYGFRRNLLGVKWLALALNVVVVVICCVMLWRTSWALEADLGKRMIVVLVVAAAHATYMLLGVRKAVVWDASRAYARELILSCEAFIASPPQSARKSPARLGTPKQDSTGDTPKSL